MAFDAGAAVGKVILNTDSWTAGVNTVKKTSMDLGKAAAGVGGFFLDLGKKAVKGIVDATKAADEFQKGVANVSTLVDTAQVDVGGMAKELLLLGGELGDAKDLTGALYQALSASVEPGKAVQFVADSAKFAGAALISTEKAVDVLSTSVNAYGAENLSAAAASDKLFSVIKLGKTDGQQLSSVLGKSIPLAANMGVSFDELGASIAIMTRQGVKSSQATTQFNSVLSAFLKPSTDMQAALEAIGFESGQAAVEQLGFKGAMDAVIDSTGGSKDEIAKLFRNTNALKGVMALTGTAGEAYAEVLNEIENSAGSTQVAFEKQEKTFETLQNQMGKIQIIVGGVAKSFADELAVGATEAANAMIQFLLSGRGAEIVSDILAGVTGVFEILKMAVKPLVEALLPAMRDLWVNVGQNLDRLLSPAGDTAGVFKVISGAIAVGVSIIKLYVKGVSNMITSLIDLVVAIKTSGGIVGKFFDFLSGKARWEDVERQVQLTGRAFETLGKGIINAGVEAFTGVIEEVQSFKERMNSGAEEMQVKWTTTFNRTKVGVLTDFNEIITGQKKVADSIIEDQQKAADSIIQGNEQIKNSAMVTYSGIQNIHSSMTQAQLNNIDSIVAASDEAFRKRIEQQELLREEQQKTNEMIINSTLPVFEAIGAAIAQGESVWEAFKTAGLDAIAGIVKAFGEQWALLAAAAFIPGPTFNPLAGAGYAAAAAGAFAAAGLISSFEDGGRASPGLAVVGEAGPELVNFRSSANVIPNDEIGRHMGKEIVFNNTFIVNNQGDAEMVSRKLGRRVKSVFRGDI